MASAASSIRSNDIENQSPTRGTKPASKGLRVEPQGQRQPLAERSNATSLKNQDHEVMDVETCTTEVMEIEVERVPDLVSVPDASSEPEYVEYVDEYVTDTIALWKAAERHTLCNPRYMSRQRELDWSMRSILIDWMAEVVQEMEMHVDTWYLAVNYLDRFLSIMSCTRGKLQLAGITAMFVASKYEEIYPPPPTDFVNLTDNTYNVRQLLKLEIQMLKMLHFEISPITTVSFLEHYLECLPQLIESTPNFSELKFLSNYWSEAVLVTDATFLQFKPSENAAATLYCAAYALNLRAWCDAIPKLTGYKHEEIRDCALRLAARINLGFSPDHRAVYTKYSQDQYNRISSRSITIDTPVDFCV